MKYSITTMIALCVFYQASFANIGKIRGDSTVCKGRHIILYDSTIGGKWSCSNISIGIIDSISGYFIGSSAGIATITYLLDTFYTTQNVTVFPLPSPIFGPDCVCFHGGTTVYDSTPVGGYFDADYTVISIYISGSNYAEIIGASGGLGSVYFIDANGCEVTKGIGCYTNNIFGDTNLISGTTETLTNFLNCGIWQSSDTSIAIVDSTTGVVTGVSIGTAIITYNVDNCIATFNLNVIPRAGVQIFGSSSEFYFYPNPAINQLNIDGIENCELLFYDVVGSLIMSFDKISTPKEIIDISQLKKGLYSIEIRKIETGMRLVNKMVKE